MELGTDGGIARLQQDGVQETGENTINMWYSLTDDVPEFSLKLFRQVLNTDETKRCRCFANEADRRAYIVSHALLRLALSSFYHVVPSRWEFLPSEYGKPELVGPLRPSIQFNITHSRQLSAICVSFGPGHLGIDTETTTVPREILSVTDTCFSASERQQLERLSPAQQQRAFSGQWTLKEAYLKAAGLGFAYPPHRFSISIHPSKPPKVDLCVLCGTKCDYWRFAQLWIPTGHVAAIAFHTPSKGGLQIRTYRVSAADSAAEPILCRDAPDSVYTLV